MRKALIVFAAVCVGAFLVVSLVPAGNGGMEGKASGPSGYSYYYKGSLVEMNPMAGLVAIVENRSLSPTLAEERGLERDPLSESGAVKEKGFGIYRAAPSGETPGEAKKAAAAAALLESAEGAVVQPVCEHGRALKIPSDEVVVGFAEDTTLKQAERFLGPCMSEQGIVSVRDLRKNTFILTIDNPSNGRCYAVSRFLSGLDGIDFAEPNHVIIMRDDQEKAGGGSQNEGRPLDISALRPLEGAVSGESQADIEAEPEEFDRGASVSWTTLLKEGFEGASVANWTTGASWWATQAVWGITPYRSHSGNLSAYASMDGDDGEAPPGPYPANCSTSLVSPELNLSSYEEVYVEVWFYAKYINPDTSVSPPTVYDKTKAALFIPSDPNLIYRYELQNLYTVYTGDCTADPTTANGWRKATFRVPPIAKRDGVHVYFDFTTHWLSSGAEGIYIDDVRVVGTKNVDAASISNDTYSARQYELRNSGQIAGLGNDNNDLHVPEAWKLTSVSSGVVVAIIDDGVDLTHPDLKLVTGYNHDGTVGGGPKDKNSNHGTACAGNAGAKGNNGIGVIGTAPGASIMPVAAGNDEAGYASAIDVAVAKGADILSNSWGWQGAPSAVIESAIKDALKAGRTVLFAAANGPDRPPWKYGVAFPALLTASTDVIAVGASSQTDEHKATASSDGIHSWGSCYIGKGPDVLSPGPWSYTTDRQGNSGYNPSVWGSMIDAAGGSSLNYTHDFGGTSSSTPKVSGIVALMLSANHRLSPAQVKSMLNNSADDIGAKGYDDKTGHGRVNAYKAVKAAIAAIPQAEVVLNGSSFGPGSNLTATFNLHKSITRPFIAFAVVIMPNGGMLNAVTLSPRLSPAALLPGLGAPFSRTLLSVNVPGGAPGGSYEILVAFFDPTRPITGRGDAFLAASGRFSLR